MLYFENMVLTEWMREMIREISKAGETYTFQLLTELEKTKRKLLVFDIMMNIVMIINEIIDL